MDLASVLLNAITFGGILAIVAIGLGIIFGMMGVINIAHGDFVMIGAYVALVITKSGLSYWTALLVAPIVLAAIGALVEVTLIRRLYESLEVTILATLGLSIVLQQVADLIFGGAFQRVRNPMPGAVEIFDIHLPQIRLVAGAIGLAIVLAIILFYTRTSFGLKVRAVSAHQALAESLGIRSKWVNTFSFAVGAALAGIAGVLIAPIGAVSPTMGATYLLPAFVVIIVGGIFRGKSAVLWGVIAGAMIVSVFDSLVSSKTDPIIAQIAVLILTMVALQLRPAERLLAREG